MNLKNSFEVWDFKYVTQLMNSISTNVHDMLVFICQYKGNLSKLFIHIGLCIHRLALGYRGHEEQLQKDVIYTH